MILPLSMIFTISCQYSMHDINRFHNTLRFDNTCFCASMQDINNAGAVLNQLTLGVSIDTCPQLASIDNINTWYRYRLHPYQTLVHRWKGPKDQNYASYITYTTKQNLMYQAKAIFPLTNLQQRAFTQNFKFCLFDT